MALFADPDPNRALAAYGALAPGYEASSRRILGIREAAIDALDLQPGETVFDVACGTAAAFELLCRRVGPEGRVPGIEQAPEMAALPPGARAAASPRIAGCASPFEASPRIARTFASRAVSIADPAISALAA